MIKICPRCNQRFSVNDQCKDYVHICNSGDETLDQDDKVVLGSWEDSGVSGTVSKSYPMVAGLANELQGTDATIHDRSARLGDLSPRGKNTPTHRVQQHEEYIDCKEGK